MTLQSMPNPAWFVVRGSWFVVRGSWSVVRVRGVRGSWLVAGGLWLVLGGCCSAAPVLTRLVWCAWFVAGRCVGAWR